MLNLNFVQDISYHKRVPRLDLVHHLLGNGHLQAIVQVTENLTCRNALVLHLMNPDRFENRPKSNSLTFHQQLGPELTMVALFHDDKLYLPHPRQTACDLQYGLTFDDEVSTFTARYPVDFTITGERAKSPFTIKEQFFCPVGHSAVVRRVQVSNRRGFKAEPARLLAFLIPNQNIFPEAHYLSEAGIGIAGHFAKGDEFLALAAFAGNDGHQVNMFPLPLDDAANGHLGDLASSCDDDHFVRPQENYTNYPLLPGSAHLGAVIALEFDLGLLEPGDTRHVDLIYAYGPSEAQIIEQVAELQAAGFDGLRNQTRQFWQLSSTVQTGDERLDNFYQAVRAGLRAGVAASGRMNAAIWGYNAQWVRDSSLASIGATCSGQFELAHSMLNTILTDLVSSEGLAFGESQFYEPRRAELDQNGELLYALWMYWVHSRDDSIIRQHWDKIVQVAQFPLRPEFWVEEVGMVKSERDQRDRDAERHGLKVGFELSHQMWTSLGLAKAADMAHLMEDSEQETGWRDLSARIWEAALHHPQFKLVEDNYLMKRRLLDGSFQRFAKVVPYVHRIDDQQTKIYPRNRHRQGELEPDGSEAWPIARGMVDPDSDLAQRTLLRMEWLWNNEWDFGGYPLHHPGSEPTKLGAWPMIFYFVTQAALETRDFDTVRRNLNWILSTKDGRGYTWWEYRDADPDYQIDHGITPWFAYGEPLTLFIHHLLGYRPQAEAIVITPHLLPDLKMVQARLRCGSHWLDLRLHNGGRFVGRATVNGKPWSKTTADSVRLDIPDADAVVEIWLQNTLPDNG